MMHGQIMLVKGTSWIAKAIQRTTVSPYSHAEIRIGNLCYSADLGGVQTRRFDQYKWPYDLYNIVGMSPEKAHQLESWCRSRVGRRYDYGKVFGIGLDLLLYKGGFRPLFDNRNAYTCVEFVWDGCQHVGLTLSSPRANLVPGDLAFETWLDPVGEPRLLKQAVGRAQGR